MENLIYLVQFKNDNFPRGKNKSFEGPTRENISAQIVAYAKTHKFKINYICYCRTEML
jgi:hypothetical protein